jgi:hypothetical protein
VQARLQLLKGERAVGWSGFFDRPDALALSCLSIYVAVLGPQCMSVRTLVGPATAFMLGGGGSRQGGVVSKVEGRSSSSVEKCRACVVVLLACIVGLRDLNSPDLGRAECGGWSVAGFAAEPALQAVRVVLYPMSWHLWLPSCVWVC